MSFMRGNLYKEGINTLSNISADTIDSKGVTKCIGND